MNHPLKVYKASAGSGKTFTLAVEYIKLLITDPGCYKNILGVTFTKKATGEMKSRILSQLYGISHGLKKSDGYLNEIKKDTEINYLSLDDNEIRHRASIALSNIIHDYSRFHITTIDSFFQSIIRELARELDLTANLRVDLNDAEVLSEAVTSIIDDLEEGSETFKYIMSYVMEKINEGKNWIITDEIEKFGKNIFNENYLENELLIRHKISDKDFMNEYKKQIIAIKNSINLKLKSLGDSFFALTTHDELEMNDFKQKGRGIYSFFKKLSEKEIIEPNSYVLKAIGNSSEWVTAKSNISLIDNRYLDLLDKAIELVENAIKYTSTTNAILSHLNHLMMLDMITARVRTLNQEANRFLLADTARFLRDMIDNNDIPFIYERTGNRFRHIMIDEFQDTSSLQWENFKALLSNSLSQNNKCLLVGDVKQSIYRWRNSDWNILNNIQQGEMAVEIDHSTIDKLDTNHRSLEEIVLFNNDFFEKSANNISDKYEELSGVKTQDIKTAYNKVSQKVSLGNKGKGYVSVCNIEIPKESNLNYTECTLINIKNSIEHIVNNGVSYNDITILVREKKHIESICLYFADSDSKINIVSEEAFKLNSSSAVNIIITALRCIANPEDIISRLTLAYLYQTEVLNSPQYANDIDKLLTEATNDTNMKDDFPCFSKFLPPSFNKNYSEYAITPLSELAEQIYDIFELEKIEKQDAYLFSFYDNLSLFLQDNSDDINKFIKLWDERIKNITIPDNSLDGIRIMTIHASKGLEFHTVIIPFCNWPMGGRYENMLWCEPKVSPYDKLPLTPVNYTKEIQKSIFKKDYDAETLKCFVDNINIVYVAFTRAESNLIVLTDKSTSGYTVNDVITSSLPKRMNVNTDDIKTTYSIGKIVPSFKTQKESIDDDPNVMTRKSCPMDSHFTHYQSQPEFRQSNESKQFINTEYANKSIQYIDEGNIIHRILEHVYYYDDLPSAIRKVEIEGIFKNEEQKKRLVDIIDKGMQNPQVKNWFSKHWNVLNERSILAWNKNGEIAPIRPDRVMTNGNQIILVDYKTGQENGAYKSQVKKYIEHLHRAGKTDIKAFIWYISLDKIIEVSL